MATQYADVSGLPSAVYRDYILTYADMWDHYVIYQSGQYEYTGYVWDDWGNSTLITITRDTNTGYNYRWRSEIQYDVQHSYTIIEPMYSYSTEIGDGQYYKPLNSDQTANIAVTALMLIMAVVLMFRRVFLWKR